MLNNEKAILCYGLNSKELDDLKATGHKIIKVNSEMTGMKIKDLLSGLNFPIVSKKEINEKIVVFNSFPDDELQFLIGITKAIAKECILAVVTPVSIEWEFDKLSEHLIEERNWYKNK